jgi:hypothetical protein
MGIEGGTCPNLPPGKTWKICSRVCIFKLLRRIDSKGMYLGTWGTCRDGNVTVYV